MMRALFLLLCLLSAQAWGATYYLDTSCSLNGNGTGASGACAASGGGAGAYNTGASIVFGAGDTIYIKRGTTVTNFPSPVSQSVTLDDYGVGDACPTISKSGVTHGLSISAANVTINDLCITGSNSSSVLNIAASGFAGNRIEVYGNSTANAIGLRFNTGSGDSSCTDCIVHDISDDGVGIGSSIVSGTITLIRLTCYLVDTGNSTGDCLQAYTGTAANLAIVGGTWTRETSNKQAIIYDGSGTFSVAGSPQIDVSAGAQGVQVAGSGTFTMTSVDIKGGASTAKLLQITSTGNGSLSGIILSGGIDGLYVSHASGAVTANNLTISGQSGAAVYHTTGGTLSISNSYMDGATAALQDASGSATTTSNYNRFGRALWYWDGVSKSSLSAWQSASSQDANSTVGEGGFVGDPTPTTASGFKLRSDSALKCAGSRTVPRFTDMLGYGSEPDCASIGALNYSPAGQDRTTALSPRTTALEAAP